ncbi:MAG: hypothetical protein V4819_26555 [Verrucomicrobiota bacterium]
MNTLKFLQGNRQRICNCIDTVAFHSGNIRRKLPVPTRSEKSSNTPAAKSGFAG